MVAQALGFFCLILKATSSWNMVTKIIKNLRQFCKKKRQKHPKAKYLAMRFPNSNYFPCMLILSLTSSIYLAMCPLPHPRSKATGNFLKNEKSVEKCHAQIMFNCNKIKVKYCPDQGNRPTL